MTMWQSQPSPLRIVKVCVLAATLVQHALCLSDYTVHAGFQSACSYKPSVVEENLKKLSTYACGGSAKLIEHHMLNKNQESFNATKFLSLLRGKKLSIIGDSVGLQNFHALELELLCEQSSKHDGNGTATSMLLLNPHGKPWRSKSHFPHIIAGVRTYDSYDATIAWCVDQMLSSATSKQYFDFCGKNTIMSDVIFVAIGAFYKPLYLNQSGTNYYESMRNASDFLLNTMYPFRELVKTMNPNALVIWRDYSHVGNHDELVYKGLLNNVKVDTNRHNNGALWKHSKEEATWVRYYNKQFKKIARLYDDVYLPFNNASHVVLDYFRDKHVAVHADAIHYCSGGLPRMANIMIQDVLERSFQK